jgi:hypothetical protein
MGLGTTAAPFLHGAIDALRFSSWSGPSRLYRKQIHVHESLKTAKI